MKDMNKRYKSNICDFKFFSNVSYKDAKEDCENFVSKVKAKKGIITIASYFNDDEDLYKVFIIGSFGDVIKKDVYCWDELSQLIHDNL